MKDKLLEFKNRHPMSVVLLIALAVRVLAMLFSKGYGYYSEYFFYVETPNAWLDNVEGSCYTQPNGISLFYLSINYLIFGFFKLIGIGNPQWLMFFSRVIHGLVSLIVIMLGYRISKIISNKEAALNVAWILSLLWFMPYIGTHTLAQSATLPFLLYGILLIVKQENLRDSLNGESLHRTTFIIAGVFLGLAFSIWYQSIMFLFLIFIILAVRKNLRGAVMSVVGFALVVSVTQTIPDLIVWGCPFAEIRMFFGGFSDNFFRGDDVFMIPYMLTAIVALYLWWNGFHRKSLYWNRHGRLHRYITAFVFFVNVIFLITTVFMYSNKAEVKAMTYLSKEDVGCYIIEDETIKEPKRPPLFYERNWTEYTIVNQNNQLQMTVNDKVADYVLFRGLENLDSRVDAMKRYYPYLEYKVTYKPYFAIIMHKWLSKSKEDGCVTIYKVNYE